MPPNPQFYHEPVAYIYLRVSTKYQTQADRNSFETQKRLCIELCEKHKIPVAKIIEQVKSGRKVRHELVNVINKELQKTDAIVVYSISRFARNQKQAHTLVDALTSKKCRLLTVTERMDTADDDKMLGIFAWVAEMESREIAERVRVSLQTKKLRGEHLGNVPYGYKFLEGKGSPIVKDDEQQKVIEQIRAWRAEGKSLYEITNRLNREQVPTPKRTKSGGWNGRSVKLILERDESKLLVKGKRSWYIEKEKQEREENPETFEEKETVDDTSEEEESSDEDNTTKETEPPTETSKELVPPNVIQSPQIDLGKKPLIFLRALLTKRREEFGISEEEIRGLEKEDIIELLLN